MQTKCFHCHTPIPQRCDFTLAIDGETQHFCCIGCRELARCIIDGGLESFYRQRTSPAPNAATLKDDLLTQLRLYDHPALSGELCHTQGDLREIILSVDNLGCAACAWLIEKQLSKLEGLVFIHVNLSTHRVLLRWDPALLKLSEALIALHQLGFKAAPFEIDKHEAQEQQNYKSHLIKLGIAGLACMQIMMFTIALYIGEFQHMSPLFSHYFRAVSLLCATPVVLYAALPFHLGALRSLSAKQLSMDVPVSLALLFAYFASAYATFTEQGEVYFESVAMFSFLLLLGRTLELRARRKATSLSANTLKALPRLARRQLKDGQVELVASSEIKVGDTLCVLSGEALPLDGVIIEGESSFDESLINGEATPVAKGIGEKVYAGAINYAQNITLRVSDTHKHSFIAHIFRMQEQAQSEKTPLNLLSDRIAQHFVLAVLLIALACYLCYALLLQSSDAFWITLSVLVVTCPCALSLAAPTAVTIATYKLRAMGLLVKRAHVIEQLATTTHIVSDKTGTLTQGKLFIVKTENLYKYTDKQVLAWACALEAHSLHPVASAFRKKNNMIDATNIMQHANLGIEGQMDGARFHLGAPRLLAMQSNAQQDLLELILWRNERPIARFYLSDTLRNDAHEFAQKLKYDGVHLSLLSGDAQHRVAACAKALNINDFAFEQSPSQKLAFIQSKKSSNPHLLMLGDGLNDGPVLSAAPLSIAMGEGSDAAKSAADALLINPSLSSLNHAITLSRQCRRIIKQNFIWAIAYNLSALPLALLGFIPPYLAALGMSLSSLLVLSNSLRLYRL